MTVAKITGQGLSAMAIAVVLLWSCIVLEKVTLRNANAEYARALRDVRALRLRQRGEPASAPVPILPRAKRPAVG